MIKLTTFNAFIAACTVFIIWREYSWQRKIFHLQNDVRQCEVNIESIHTSYQVLIKESECSHINIDEFNFNLIPKNILQKRSKNHVKIYDLNGFLQQVAYVSVMLIEMNYIHESYLSSIKDERQVISSDVYMKLYAFIMNRLSIVNLIFFTIICASSVLAWFSIIDPSAYIYTTIKMLLIWSASFPIAYIINNAIKIYPYLPNTQDKYRESSVWLWIISKLLAIDNSYYCLQGISNIILNVVYVWPYRYIFYYSNVSFDDETTLINFTVNMLLHSSFVWIWLCLTTSLVFNTRDSLIRSYFDKKVNSSGTPIIIFTCFQAFLCISYIIRIFLFVFWSWQCLTWYSYLIVLSLLNIYILAFLFGIVPFNGLMQRYLVIQSNKTAFTEQFVSQAKKSSTVSQADEINNVNQCVDDIQIRDLELEEEKQREKDLIETGNQMFDYILDCTSVIAFFTRPDEHNNSDIKTNAEEKKGSSGDGDMDESAYFMRLFEKTMIKVAWVHSMSSDDSADSNSSGDPSAQNHE